MANDHPLEKKTLEKLSELTGDFTPGSAQRLDDVSSVTFLRECVAPHLPAILTNMFPELSLESWNPENLVSKCNGNVKVNFTKNGRADSVNEIKESGLFIYPLEREISFSVFMDMLLDPKSEDAVPYLSAQNDNFRNEGVFKLLEREMPRHISLAEDAFGLTSPEAVNIWIGDERSVSSLHKDHFENFYCVLHGSKTFTLFPPTDGAFLPLKKCDTSMYFCKTEKSFSERIMKDDLGLTGDGCPAKTVPWITYDPDDPSEEVSEMVKLSHPIRCVVNAGETLYIPALWLHRVSQTCPTVAVNYWYDMRFDLRYVFNQTMLCLAGKDEICNEEIENDQNDV